MIFLWFLVLAFLGAAIAGWRYYLLESRVVQKLTKMNWELLEDSKEIDEANGKLLEMNKGLIDMNQRLLKEVPTHD